MARPSWPTPRIFDDRQVAAIPREAGAQTRLAHIEPRLPWTRDLDWGTWRAARPAQSSRTSPWVSVRSSPPPPGPREARREHHLDDGRDDDAGADSPSPE